MKTAEERAEDFIEKLCLGSYRTLLIDGLIRLIKEQDRDTRHACADSVSKISSTKKANINLIDQDQALAVIINTKAV